MLSHLFFLLSCNHLSVKMSVNTCKHMVAAAQLKQDMRNSTDCYWMLVLSLSCLGRLLASTSSPPLPAPELSIYLRSRDSVVLVCQAPKGHRGVFFMLYRHVNKVVRFWVFFNLLFPQVSKDLICPLIALYSLRWTPSRRCLVPRRSISLWG